MTDVVVEKQGHVAVVKIEHMKAMNALSTDMELTHITPSYCGWQQEIWVTHCDDFCAFVGYVGAKELKEMGVLEEVIENGSPEFSAEWSEEQIEIIKNMVDGGHVQGYLFKCLHCGKYFLYYDVD